MSAASDGAAHLMTAEFWRAPNAGDVDVTRETTRRISPPDVAAFSFGEGGGNVSDRGTLKDVGKLVVHSPAAVFDTCNSPKEVNLITASSDWCLALLSDTQIED